MQNRRRAGRDLARDLAALLAVEPNHVGGKLSTGLRGHAMEEAHRRRGYATVAAVVRGGQPRGEAVWGRRNRRSRACRTDGMNTTRDGQLARLSPAALRKDGGACGGGQLRASAHAVSGQALWCKTNGCVLSNGLRGKQDIRLLKRCPSGGPHRAGNFISAVAAGTETLQRLVRGRRSRSLRIHDDASLGLMGVTAITDI